MPLVWIAISVPEDATFDKEFPIIPEKILFRNCDIDKFLNI